MKSRCALRKAEVKSLRTEYQKKTCFSSIDLQHGGCPGYGRPDVEGGPRKAVSCGAGKHSSPHDGVCILVKWISCGFETIRERVFNWLTIWLLAFNSTSRKLENFYSFTGLALPECKATY